MKYAVKMIIDRKTGNVRQVAKGRAPDGAESHRKYLAPIIIVIGTVIYVLQTLVDKTKR